MYNFPPLLRCFDDYIRGKYIIYIFPRNVRHPAKSTLKNQVQNLPRQMRGTRRFQPATSIKNLAPLRKRYHRGTQRAEGRGCGKDFSWVARGRARGRVRVRPGVRVSTIPANDRASLRLACALCAWCALLCPVTMRTLGYGLIGRNRGRMLADLADHGRMRPGSCPVLLPAAGK